jgi:hypothetical protein
MEVLDSHIALRRKMHDFMLIYWILKVTVFSVPNDTFFSNYWLSAILIDPAKTEELLEK